MFGETEKLKAGVFDRKLEESGAETNAATWVDWTYYHELLPADRLRLAVDLEAERMQHLVLREPQVASEKEVVANERRYRVDDDVEGVANELLYKTAFTRHPYHWPTIGWMEDIKNFTPEDCTAFYRTYYAPNNATVVVVGDVRERSLLQWIQSAYGTIPSQTVPAEDVIPEPPQTDERRLELRKPTASEKLLIAFKGPALGDADHATMSVLSEVLFGGRASRLYRTLVVEKELAIDVRGWVSTFRDPGLFECWVTARGAHTTPEILPVLDQAFARVRAEVVERRGGRARQGAARARLAPAARDGRRQGGADRLLRAGPRRTRARVPARRGLPARDGERPATGRQALPRRRRADRPARRPGSTATAPPAPRPPRRRDMTMASTRHAHGRPDPRSISTAAPWRCWRARTTCRSSRSSWRCAADRRSTPPASPASPASPSACCAAAARG